MSYLVGGAAPFDAPGAAPPHGRFCGSGCCCRMMDMKSAAKIRLPLARRRNPSTVASPSRLLKWRTSACEDGRCHTQGRLGGE